jgi:hypothetical protein
VSKLLVYFFGIALGVGVAVAIPVRHWWGNLAALEGVVALLICAVPSGLTLLWSGWAMQGRPEQQLVAVLGGTGLRLLVVSLLGLALSQRVEWLQEDGHFWTWVLAYYLFTLALETALTLQLRPASTQPKSSAMPPVAASHGPDVISK